MNTCFFCGFKPGDAAQTVQVPVYKLKRYAHLGVVRRFEYSKMIVSIDRCPECAQYQLKAKRLRKRETALWTAGGFIIGLAVPGAFLFTAILAGFLGYFVAGRRQKRKLSNLGRKGLDSASLATQPVLADLLREGWTTKKP